MGASAVLYAAPFLSIAPGAAGEQYVDLTITGSNFDWRGFTWNDSTKNVNLALEVDTDRLFDPEFVPIKNLIVDRGNGFFFKEPMRLLIGKKVRIKVKSDEATTVDKIVISIVGDPVKK